MKWAREAHSGRWLLNPFPSWVVRGRTRDNYAHNWGNENQLACWVLAYSQLHQPYPKLVSAQVASVDISGVEPTIVLSIGKQEWTINSEEAIDGALPTKLGTAEIDRYPRGKMLVQCYGSSGTVKTSVQCCQSLTIWKLLLLCYRWSCFTEL